MIVKVCGLKDAENLRAICQLTIDWVGYNFYPLSSRYLEKYTEAYSIVPKVRVGVFVKENIETILSISSQYKLDYVQLHGDEDVITCGKIQTIVPVIKVFRIDVDFDAKMLEDYQDVCTYYLFDTATPLFGGSGHKFDWSVLHKFNINKPFILSGGIRLEDIESIKNINHPYFAGVDINSKFESIPGVKDVEMVCRFATSVKNSDF